MVYLKKSFIVGTNMIIFSIIRCWVDGNFQESVNKETKSSIGLVGVYRYCRLSGDSTTVPKAIASSMMIFLFLLFLGFG